MFLVAIAIFVVGLVAIFLFSELWYRIGLGAAIAVLVAVLLYLGWRTDQKDREAREELEGI